MHDRRHPAHRDPQEHGLHEAETRRRIVLHAVDLYAVLAALRGGGARRHRPHRTQPARQGHYCRGGKAPYSCASDLDEIAAQANDTVYGLGAGIWTKDISKAHALAKKIRAGTVWINCYNVFDASLPFGGYKQSGWGREMGHEVLEAYTEVKAVTTQL